ncbi:predicted protein [Chaetomium globosum CBS 148.51]|uniref:Uncharacterized protein n=1 Tax=Chaetomium globosum (strain ATCC 6205 / CBS 148.51 / DSM 1962 / NBRC 6347 / NRRL 1970) TaxID=306901 RepID=Q2GWK0_CHAGB|nr:uncharacterized protein CHGG_07654 [Chaetomium globosum CBS 148.51]EAQ86401.1 predicted protein [Chaetomium globosum CBS 148.51]
MLPVSVHRLGHAWAGLVGKVCGSSPTTPVMHVGRRGPILRGMGKEMHAKKQIVLVLLFLSPALHLGWVNSRAQNGVVSPARARPRDASLPDTETRGPVISCLQRNGDEKRFLHERTLLGPARPVPIPPAAPHETGVE